VKKTPSINLEINLFCCLPVASNWTDPLFPLLINLENAREDVKKESSPRCEVSFLSSVETLYGGSGGSLHARQRAESVRLYSKNWVELAAKVFESDDRS